MNSIQQQQPHAQPAVSAGEQLSALCDGELQGSALADAVQAVLASDETLGTWATYHSVGDVLRSGELAPSRLGAGFAGRVQARLAAESAVPLAPAPVVAVVGPAAGNAANQGRWRLLAGFASVALVAAIAWTVFAPADNSGAQLALTPVPGPSASVASVGGPDVLPRVDGVNAMSVAGAAAPQVMLRDARLDAFLQAHRQAGGNSALQMPAGFLRNATFDAPAR